ncbi:MAG TPA: hypothetical protein VHJ78_03830 [Actinomycetota bacterium]|nr:hypothetical protein [Actinomycetota bacterium]
MAIPQGAIRKAWIDKKDEIEKTFTIASENDRPASNAPQLPDYQANIPDIGLCADGGRSASTFWKSEGDSTLRVSELFVWNLKDAKQQDPIFSPDGGRVVLPIGFSLLQVKGSFDVSTDCACYSFFGSKLNSNSRTVHGHLFETYNSGRLDFSLSIAGPKLAYQDVSIPGTPSLQAGLDDGLPEWLQRFAGFMAGHDIHASIRSSMVNVFATPAFTGRMIETLNKAIGH